MPRRSRSGIAVLLLCLGLGLSKSPGATAQQNDPPPAIAIAALPKPALTADEVASRLQERNREREAALRKLQGTRIYQVQYHGFFGTRDAEMVVNYNYAAPNDKEFTVVSQSGSKFVIDHVIKGLLDGEKEAATDENHDRSALDNRNYKFALDDAENSRDASQYVLDVIPKTDNKFLYRGKIWVDAKDFAVTHIEAEPAKSPSFWVKKSEVHHRYEKVDDFWLPAENKTESWIRMGGHALLSIEYKDYKITESTPLAPVAEVGSQAPSASTKISGEAHANSLP